MSYSWRSALTLWWLCTRRANDECVCGYGVLPALVGWGGLIQAFCVSVWTSETYLGSELPLRQHGKWQRHRINHLHEWVRRLGGTTRQDCDVVWTLVCATHSLGELKTLVKAARGGQLICPITGTVKDCSSHTKERHTWTEIVHWCLYHAIVVSVNKKRLWREYVLLTLYSVDCRG